MAYVSSDMDSDVAGGDTTATLVLTGVSEGDKISVFSFASQSIDTITDDDSNSYSLSSAELGTGFEGIAAWAVAGAAGTVTITITYDATANYVTFAHCESAADAAPFQEFANNSGSGTAPVSDSFTTTEDDQTVVSAALRSASGTITCDDDTEREELDFGGGVEVAKLQDDHTNSTGSNTVGFTLSATNDWTVLTVVWGKPTAVDGAVAFDASGNLAVAGNLAAIRSVSFSGTGALSPVPVKAAVGAISFSGTGSLSPAGAKVGERALSFDAAGSLAIAGTKNAVAAVSFSAAANLAMTGETETTEKGGGGGSMRWTAAIGGRR